MFVIVLILEAHRKKVIFLCSQRFQLVGSKTKTKCYKRQRKGGNILLG